MLCYCFVVAVGVDVIGGEIMCVSGCSDGAGSRIVVVIVAVAIVNFVVVIVVVVDLLSIVGGGVVCVSGGWRVGEVSPVDSQSGGGRVAHLPSETRERPDPSRRQPARILGDFSSCDATQQQTDSE